MPEYSFIRDRLRIDSDQILDPLQAKVDQATPANQIQDLVRSAFEAPINFPPIADAIIADDTVAIAVGENVPNGIDVAVAIADLLVDLGHKKSNVQIISSEKPKRASGDAHEVDGWPVEIHDPTDEQASAYLLVDMEGRPYYINRLLFDADVVIPIGNSDGQKRRDSISPAFCSAETKRILGKLSPDESLAADRLIAHSLGVFWQVQIINTPGQSIHAVLVGDNDEVLDQSSSVGESVWSVSNESDPAGVLATIEADECQAWENVRQAIMTADQFATSDGPIVICCDIGRQPPSWWAIGEAGEPEKDLALADVFQHRHVYLASRLNQEATEKFGFGFVADSDQLQRLVDSFENILLLREGHKVRWCENAAAKAQ